MLAQETILQTPALAGDPALWFATGLVIVGLGVLVALIVAVSPRR